LEQSVKQLFIDFILNRCSKAQIEEVKKLIDKGIYQEEWEAAAIAAMPDFEHASPKDLFVDEEKIFLRIQQDIHLKPAANPVRLWRKLSIAASIMLVAGISYWLISSRHPLPAAKVRNTTAQLAAQRPQEHKWIKLPDGSSVHLNSNSKLDFPESFNGNAREVTLEGEAYFDISHDAAKPFIIHTGNIRTTVLGTAFNIRAYRADTAVTVTVTRGKVKVEEGPRMLAILTPDQQISWRPAAKQFPVEHVDARSVVNWKNEDLIMDDISLAEAAILIETRYHLKVKFENEQVKSCRFTAAFLNRNDIQQVIHVISAITGAELQLKNNLITINGPGC